MLSRSQDVILHESLYAKEKVATKILLKPFLSFCFRKSKYFLLGLDVCVLTAFLMWSSTAHQNENFFIGITFLNVVWLFLAYVRGLYTFVLVNDAEVIVRKIVKQWAEYTVCACFLYYLLLSDVFEYAPFFVGLLLLFTMVFVSRVLFLSIRKKYRHVIVKKRKVVIIGNNTYSQIFEKYIKAGCSDAVLYDRKESNQVKLCTDEWGVSDLYHMRQNGVSEVYCCISAFNKEGMQCLLKEADKYMIRVKFLPEFLNIFERNISIQTLAGVPIVSVRQEPLYFERNKFIKRTFDVIFSLFVILFILSWLIPIIWLCIRLESRGPLFFKQKRTGMDDRHFFCYKFRSMTANNATADKMQATKNDKRITKVGAVLRKTSLDELPQFFNVLAGSMSVVGPRPHMISHTDEYSKNVEAYMIRHYVKPGITGWAQVNGFRGETKELSAMQNRVTHDINYVENWSLLLDCKIIFLTVWNILKGEENAY